MAVRAEEDRHRVAFPGDAQDRLVDGGLGIVGDDERVMLSGVIEIPARCVVRIVRLEEVSD